MLADRFDVETILGRTICLHDVFANQLFTVFIVVALRLDDSKSSLVCLFDCGCLLFCINNQYISLWLFVALDMGFSSLFQRLCELNEQVQCEANGFQKTYCMK
jgi:hypothetical protein